MGQIGNFSFSSKIYKPCIELCGKLENKKNIRIRFCKPCVYKSSKFAGILSSVSHTTDAAYIINEIVNVIYTLLYTYSTYIFVKYTYTYVSRWYDIRVFIEIRDDSSHLSGFQDMSVITLPWLLYLVYFFSTRTLRFFLPTFFFYILLIFVFIFQVLYFASGKFFIRALGMEMQRKLSIVTVYPRKT